MTESPAGSASPVTGPESATDDAHYPAYRMGAAARAIGVTPAFLRALGDAGLFEPHRSEGGHRRYSRVELDLAARAREVVDEGVPVAAAVRIVRLEYQLAAARAALDVLRRRHGTPDDAVDPDPAVPGPDG